MKPRVVLVSACLLGLRTAYDDRVKAIPPALAEAIAAGHVVPVPYCPEQGGGLATPRLPAEIRGGSGEDVLAGRAIVHRIDGADVTAEFVRGAEDAAALARLVGAGGAILKERSPSCGVSAIHDGTHSGTLRPGRGVAAAALAALGIPLYTEETFPEAALGS